MKSPYGLDIFDSCTTCPVREQHLFCNLSPSAVQRLDEITSAAVYPKASVLFVEGQRPRGVFVLCTGKAKLFASARDGKTIITKISEAGDVLGLNAIISNRPYEVTAEMIEPGSGQFHQQRSSTAIPAPVSRGCPASCPAVRRNYYTAHEEEIRTLGLTSSPSGKFAKLLLSWIKEGNAKEDRGLKLTLTHEEIAEIIGTTRETVSRLFSDFKRKQFIQSEASSLVILDKSALERMVQA